MSLQRPVGPARKAITRGLFALILFCFVWGFLIEPSRLVVHETTLHLPAWPRALDGTQIALLSDLHVGAPFVREEKLAAIVAATNRTTPDLILLAGDFVVGDEPLSRRIAPEIIAHSLAGLRARLGVYAVLGNHDEWEGAPRIRAALEAAGIHVLDNDVAEIRDRGASIWIAGLADYMTRDQKIAATVARAGDLVIALTHEPDSFPEVPARVALTLAGHTHGGQIALPFIGALIVPSRYGVRYAAGHIVEGGKHLFVTSGIGTSILPARFGVTPEIALLTLAAAP
uniref:Putative phosphohydrolase n=1 Tax=Aetherobacter rufus TaxID=888831 RepID=A0A3Q8I4X4_9BACT|nr:putative phosphohydrolase [Aetherobacter rufus]